MATDRDGPPITLRQPGLRPASASVSRSQKLSSVAVYVVLTLTYDILLLTDAGYDAETGDNVLSSPGGGLLLTTILVGSAVLGYLAAKSPVLPLAISIAVTAGGFALGQSWWFLDDRAFPEGWGFGILSLGLLGSILAGIGALASWLVARRR